MRGASAVAAAALLAALAAPAPGAPDQAPPAPAVPPGVPVGVPVPPSPPSPVPSSPPPPARRGTLVVHGVGDVSLDPAYIPALREHGYAHAWSGLDGLFAGDDLTVVNLECAVSTLGRPVPKAFNFRCDPAALPAAIAAGVEVANLANNHSGDFGPEALLDSVAQLSAAGIAPVGAGADDVSANRAALLVVDGWRVAVLGFGAVSPSPDWIAAPGRPGMADGYDVAGMTAAVRAASAVADLVFVTIHWGRELDTEPRDGQIAAARAMIDAGADGLFGHHSHRLQPLTTYAGRPIAWGLGNFVWPRLSTDSARTAVAEFVVGPDGAITACLLPAVIAASGHPTLTEPYAGPCG